VESAVAQALSALADELELELSELDDELEPELSELDDPDELEEPADPFDELA
jgi:hypothetical protein